MGACDFFSSWRLVSFFLRKKFCWHLKRAAGEVQGSLFFLFLVIKYFVPVHVSLSLKTGFCLVLLLLYFIRQF
jgi:hypothetical protein